jgi:hypothetical protein
VNSKPETPQAQAGPETFRPLAEVAIGLNGARDELLTVPPWLTPDEERELRARFGDLAFEEARQRWQKYRSKPQTETAAREAGGESAGMGQRGERKGKGE